jgi:hypothetical protein
MVVLGAIRPTVILILSTHFGKLLGKKIPVLHNARVILNV